MILLWEWLALDGLQTRTGTVPPRCKRLRSRWRLCTTVITAATTLVGPHHRRHRRMASIRQPYHSPTTPRTPTLQPLQVLILSPDRPSPAWSSTLVDTDSLHTRTAPRRSISRRDQTWFVLRWTLMSVPRWTSHSTFLFHLVSRVCYRRTYTFLCNIWEVDGYVDVDTTSALFVMSHS